MAFAAPVEERSFQSGSTLRNCRTRFNPKRCRPENRVDLSTFWCRLRLRLLAGVSSGAGPGRSSILSLADLGPSVGERCRLATKDGPIGLSLAGFPLEVLHDDAVSQPHDGEASDSVDEVVNATGDR